MPISLVIPNLPSSTNIDVRVRAFNQAGFGPYSTTASLSTFGSPTPNPPPSPTSGSVVVDFNSPTGKTASGRLFGGFSSGLDAHDGFTQFVNDPNFITSAGKLRARYVRINGNELVIKGYNNDTTLFDRLLSTLSSWADPTILFTLGVGPTVGNDGDSPATWAQWTVNFLNDMHNKGKDGLFDFEAVGNENDGMDVNRFTDYYVAIANAVHGLNRGYKIGATCATWWGAIDLTTFFKRTTATNASGRVDFFSFHSYRTNPQTPESDVYDTALDFSDASDIRSWLTNNTTNSADKNMLIRLTESGMQGDFTNPDPREGNIVRAIYDALQIRQCFQSTNGFDAHGPWDFVLDGNYGCIGNAVDGGDMTKITPNGWMHGIGGQLMVGDELAVSTTLPSVAPFAVRAADGSGRLMLVNYGTSAQTLTLGALGGTFGATPSLRTLSAATSRTTGPPVGTLVNFTTSLPAKSISWIAGSTGAPQVSRTFTFPAEYRGVALVESPSGTRVPPAAQLIDAQGRIWTIQGGQEFVGGQVVSDTQGVTQLLYFNHGVYQLANGAWYGPSSASTGGPNIPGDPSVTPSPTPTPTPTPTPGGTNPNPAPNGAVLLFEDTFPGATINTSKWRGGYFYQSGGPAGKDCWEIPFGADPAINVYTQSGNTLLVGVKPVPANKQSLTGGLHWAVGNLNTYGNFSRTFGYWEVTARLIKNRGCLSAIWMYAVSDATNHSMELDITETASFNPTDYHMTTHPTNIANPQDFTIPDSSAGFHSYGIDWNNNTTTWYFDRTAIRSGTTPSDLKGEMYLIISDYTQNDGTEWWGGPNVSLSDTWPDGITVSNVVVYDKRPFLSDVTTLPETTVTASRLPPEPAPVPRGPPRLSHKRLDVTITKGKGAFQETGTNAIKLSGARISATVTKAGGVSMSTLQMRLYGMTASKMNDLSTLGMTVDVYRLILNNQIVLEAGDDDTGMAVIHHGTIYDAWTDYNAMPDVAFVVTSYTGLYEAGKPVFPTSYRGLVDVGTIMSGIANLAGWAFQNHGVDVRIDSTYLPGTAWDQMQSVADAANINATLDDGTPKTLVIWPKDGDRGGEAVLISAASGMIGYPTYTVNGIIITTRFNPALGSFGQIIKVQSDVKQANGLWKIATLAHSLDAETPHGQWQTRIEATPKNFQPPQIRTSAP